MNNGVGYNRMLADIRNVALGTDGINSDMHEELSCAFFKHRDEHGPLGPDQFLSFLYNGNRILERTFSAQFGRLEPGYKADLVISHYSPPTPLVAENLAGHLAFGMRSKDVETVIINGEIVYENRRFPFDVGPLYRDARREAHALWQGMDSLDKQ
jgi:cytosine/adenosine deaminase-related metal-dependent hydrolase